MLSWCYHYFVLVVVILFTSSTILIVPQNFVNSSSYHVIRSHHNHKVGVLRYGTSISLLLSSSLSLSQKKVSSLTTTTRIYRPKITTSFISSSSRYHQQQQQQQSRLQLPFQQQQQQLQRRHGSHLVQYLARSNSSNNNKQDRWDGDDIRFFSKLSRNLKRISKGNSIRQRQLCYTIVITNIALYCYQVLNTIYMIKLQYPYQWSNHMFSIIMDCIVGSAKPGPLTLDMVHHSYYSMIQPHRFISSGFIHGGIIHLLANMSSLLSLPLWLENGLSPLLYLTTYLLSIIGGNVFDVIMNIDSGIMSQSYALGASGGICGLYGLMYICLIRMGNNTAALRILKGMGLLLVYGIIFTHISNTAHIGGFISGVLLGIICGPFYERSYILKRKNSLQYETLSREYRNIIGYDKKPTLYGYISTSVLWISIISIILLSNQSKYIIIIPQMIIQSILHPGTISSLIGIKF